MRQLIGLWRKKTQINRVKSAWKQAVAVLICLVLLVPLGVQAEEQEIWFHNTADLSTLNEVIWTFVVVYETSDVLLHFSKELTDKYTMNTLLGMVMRAGFMNSVSDFETRYRLLGDGTLRVQLTGLKMRSGENMLEAYMFDDRSRLTKEENKCLNKIESLMNDLMRKHPSGSLELEIAIYDYICEHVRYQTYPTGDKRHEACTSATNAFLHGWGNCQAYSDLFRLMASIGGFNVGLVSGETNENHMWNWIGIWTDTYHEFMVDVTFGDSDEYSMTNHYYMNFGLDRKGNHTWYEELFPQHFEQFTDDRNTYYGSNVVNGCVTGTLTEAAQYCASMIKSGKKHAEALIRMQKLQKSEIQKALEKAMGRVSYRWKYHFNWYDNYTVLCFSR